MKGLQPGTSSYLEPLLKPSAETVALDLDEDRDVKTERHRVLSGSIDNAIIYLRNLQKVSLGLHKITVLKVQFCKTNTTPCHYCIIPISGVSWRNASRLKSCSTVIDFLSSSRRMFWIFRNKWCWENHNTFYAVWYVKIMSQYMILNLGNVKAYLNPGSNNF